MNPASSPWVGDVVEGGEEDLHGTGTSGRVIPGSGIVITSERKGGRSVRRSNAIALMISLLPVNIRLRTLNKQPPSARGIAKEHLINAFGRAEMAG